MPSFVYLAPSLCCCLAISLSAQALTSVTPVAVASTAVGQPTVFTGVPANVPANYVQLATSPSGIDGASLGASSPTIGFGGSLRIDTAIFFLGASSVSRAAGTATSNGLSGPAFGPVELLVGFHAVPGAHGQLTLDASAIASPSPGTVTLVNQASIDVNADGTIEASSTSGPVMLSWVAPASGELVVKLTIDNHAAGTGFLYSSSRTEVTLVLDPPSQCTVTPYGVGCGGATSSATLVTSASAHMLVLNGAGGFANAPTVSAFGTQNTGPTLPGGCALVTDAVILAPFLSDALGATQHLLFMPVSALGTLYHQFVSIDLATFTFRASNGIEIHCVP